MPNFRIIKLDSYPLTRNLQIQSDDINYNFSLITGSGGAGNPGGSDTQLQYNNGGSFGGISVATFNGSTVSITSLAATGGLHGTSSWARNVVSASYALVAGSVLGSITSASYALTSSYAFTASHALNALNAVPSFFIATGSITASVNVTPNELFLVKSASVSYFNISSSGNTTISSNLFIVRNLSTQKPILSVSQSVVQITTQSSSPVGSTLAGSLWFTATDFYVGLD